MKFILLSDVHLLWSNPEARLDSVVDTQFDKLKFIFDYTQRIKAVILQSGDLFDRPRSWYLLPRFMLFLQDYLDVEIYTIFGQHDTYMYHEETRSATSLGILEKAGLVEILDSDPYFMQGTELYGCSWGQEIPKVNDKTPPNVLVIHAPIAEEALWHGHNYLDSTRFLRENKDFDLILCGDIHRQFIITVGGRTLINTGPMLRKEASEYNLSHTPRFAVYDTEDKSIEWVDIPHKPADMVLSRSHIESAKENSQMLDEFIKSIPNENVSKGDEVDFKTNLKNFIVENNIGSSVVKLISGRMDYGE